VIFLVTCHGIVEDTLIFVVIGANGALLVALRVTAAIFLTYFLSHRVKFKGVTSLKTDNVQEGKQ
jgi:hypothetical protein